MKFLLNILLLGYIFLFITPTVTKAADSDLISHSHAARVIVPRAIVYADELMSSPVGYISNDKLITVGNPRKKNPQLLPIVIYGRLAFIERKNVSYENADPKFQNSPKGASREHNIDKLLPYQEDRILKNNSVYFFLHQFSAGTQTNRLFEEIDGSSKNSFKGFGMSFIHRSWEGPYLVGLGLEYSSLTSANIDFNTFMISPIIGYTFYRTPVCLMDALLSLDLSLISKLKFSYSTNASSPFFYGPKGEVRLVFFPNRTFHLTGALGYRTYQVQKIEALTDAKGLPVDNITNVSGINLAVGFSIEI